jgi:outer membrane receptor protein involved in Fe transport
MKTGMKSMSRVTSVAAFGLASLSLLPMTIASAQDDTKNDETEIEELVVVGKSRVYGNNLITDEMRLQQSPITSINAVIDNLPGVSVQEGDTYGFDDWSTAITVRGFQTNLSEQQVGSTIDGFPNGNSNYGGGAKANRYIDAANLGGVEVSQGTADIASRSHEALGGTLNFLTEDPLDSTRIRTQLAVGDYDAQRMYIRYDTGLFAGDNRAWFSVSTQEATDWINGAAENERDHVAAKLVSNFGNFDVSAYAMYDKIHEDNYQRLYSADEFVEDPKWDRLTAEWTGIPYIDQAYRPGWSTLRDNLFGYLKAGFQANEDIRITAGVYYHDNSGRGDWVPQYILDLVDDQGGPESEVTGALSQDGGSGIGRIYFVDGNGVALSHDPNCVSSITFPYGGAGPQYDPGCYPANAIAVQSYRHTHYAKERTGLTADATWDFVGDNFENTLRGGFWFEDATRDEYRDWHKITDTRIGHEFDKVPYYTQYNRSYPQDTLKWYIEDTITTGPFTATLGLKKFMVDVDRDDLFGESSNASINSDSDVLLSGGLLWNTPVEGLEIFAGYAENFKAIGDLILERPDSELDTLKPETAENIEVGVRYANGWLLVSATAYDINFENRIIFLSPETSAGPDYDIGTSGTYFNAGGIESNGIEIAADVALGDMVSMYFSYTDNDSTYLGTGDPLVDAAQGITPGNKVAGIADTQFVASLNFIMNNITGGISAKHTGDRHVNTGNTWLADSYTTADAYISMLADNGQGMFKNMDITLAVNNVFDASYLGTVSSNAAWIGAPRTYSLSANIDF